MYPYQIEFIGDDPLHIHKLNATFGKLDNQSLHLRDGLNVLYAPNETGKSTWCAFLCNMLYGLPTRDRSPLADKNRYAPWSGAAMQGRMELEAKGREITIVRDTARANAPMGRFTAVYTGTAEPVPDLTGPACGESLLGVPREVFERSAFVRQAGLAVGQTAELERRIASLITTGDEDTSYIESYERLKKQLNRRQHNKTGLIPALDAELSELRRQLDAVAALEQELAEAKVDTERLTQQEAALREALTAHERWEAAQQCHSLKAVQTAAHEAQTQATALRQQLEAERIPENETIGRLRGAIVNLETVRRSVDKAREDRDTAARVCYKAEAAVNESPFAGQSIEAAQREIAEPPKPLTWNIWPCLFTIFLGCGGAFALFFALSSSGMSQILCLAVLIAMILGSSLLASFLRKRFIQKAQRTALGKRFGTADPAEIAALTETYAKLLGAKDAAQADLAGKSAAAESLSATLTTNEQGILLEIRRFAPSAFDISTADGLLRSCAVRRRALAEAESAAREAALRCDYQSQQLPYDSILSEEASPPETDRTAVAQQLEAVGAALRESRSAADRITGRLHALGDPGDLRAAEEELSARRESLCCEYEAIALAMETLSDSNTDLQNRFSPALGKEAADIFSRLTGGKYHKILLDRELAASAEETDAPLAREAKFLSQGAFDQLYLSLRLAICDLVLPEEACVPLILDDALVSFDDDRAKAALTYLKEVARKRQVLLFTCQHREMEILSDDPEAAIQRLS